MLFDADSHGALIMELKNKLAAIPEGGSDSANAAVAQWLGGIRPALDEAVEDIQEKKAFLVIFVAHSSCMILRLRMPSLGMNGLEKSNFYRIL